MDSSTWTTLKVKQNLLKTKQNLGDLDNNDRCLYIYFSLGNNYNLLNFIIEKCLSAPYPYISHTLQMVHKDPVSNHLYLLTFSNPQPPPLQPAEVLIPYITQKPQYSILETMTLLVCLISLL